MKTKLLKQLKAWLVNVTPEKPTGLIPILVNNTVYGIYVGGKEYISQLTPEEKVVFVLLIMESEEI